MFVKNDYNPITVALRIKSVLKTKKMTQKELFTALGMAINTLDNYKKSMPKSDNLAWIADYLDCSVDYLLGRTDNPNINGNSVIQSSNIVNGNNGDHSPLTVTETEQQDEMTKELVKAFQSMSFTDKMEIMNAVLEKTKK